MRVDYQSIIWRYCGSQVQLLLFLLVPKDRFKRDGYGQGIVHGHPWIYFGINKQLFEISDFRLLAKYLNSKKGLN